jgi:hypothetical protein
MVRNVVVCAILLLAPAVLQAQPYVGHKLTRHRFAQLNIGADNLFLSGDKSQVRLLFGGTHFWGHADFYIGIPVLTIGNGPFYTSVETGARFYPWRIESNKLRPYAGFSFIPTIYQQGDGVFLIRNRYPLNAGITYTHGKHMLTFGATYNYQNAYSYYMSPSVQETVKPQPLFFSLGYKYMIETTLSAEKSWESGYTQRLTDTLTQRRKLNGLTIAAGLSSAFFTGNSSYNDSLPYIDDHKTSGVFPDIAAGYYFHKPDIQTAISYRSYKSRISAYGHQQVAARRSLALEGYKFFADYHGFAPFAGLLLGYESLNVTDMDVNGGERTGSFNGISPGIVAGWDIRPNRLQGFYLRTNLRYSPFLNISMPGDKEVSFSALEINFIQLVIFPGRIF